MTKGDSCDANPLTHIDTHVQDLQISVHHSLS